MWVIFKFCITGIAWHIVCTDAKKDPNISHPIYGARCNIVRSSKGLQAFTRPLLIRQSMATSQLHSIANCFIKVEYLPIYPSTMATFSSFSVYHLRPHLSIPLTSGSVNQHTHRNYLRKWSVRQRTNDQTHTRWEHLKTRCSNVSWCFM